VFFVVRGGSSGPCVVVVDACVAVIVLFYGLTGLLFGLSSLAQLVDGKKENKAKVGFCLLHCRFPSVRKLDLICQM